MKKILCLLLCLVLMLPMVASCSKAPEYSEIEARLKELIEASYEINEIFFGQGLATYERVTDARATTKIYQSSEGEKQYQYYEISDPSLGRVVAYCAYYETIPYVDEATGNKYFYYSVMDDTYGKVIVVNAFSSDEEDRYLQILDEPKAGKTPDYQNSEKNIYGYFLEEYTHQKSDTFSYVQVCSSPNAEQQALYEDPAQSIYCYALSAYTEPTYEMYYDSDDPQDYDYVRLDAEYLSIAQIKEAAALVYSAGYLESIYDTLFVGTAGLTDQIDGLSARYIEYTDTATGAIWLMKSNTFSPLVTERRLYDFSTAKLVRPKNGQYVTVEIESYLESKPQERTTVKLGLLLQDGQWMLDSATY